MVSTSSNVSGVKTCPPRSVATTLCEIPKSAWSDPKMGAATGGDDDADKEGEGKACVTDAVKAISASTRNCRNDVDDGDDDDAIMVIAL